MLLLQAHHVGHGIELVADLLARLGGIPRLFRRFGASDADRLQRVVSNPISNAVKYGPDGGYVVVQLARDGDSAILSVEDHGLGIPAADIPYIFEPYSRASNVVGRIDGSGLGLTGARDIVEQHGRTLTAESIEGEGSTLVMRLPLDIDGAAPREQRGT